MRYLPFGAADVTNCVKVRHGLVNSRKRMRGGHTVMLMRANNDYPSIAAVRVFRNIHDGYPVVTMLMVKRSVMRMRDGRVIVAVCKYIKDYGRLYRRRRGYAG